MKLFKMKYRMSEFLITSIVPVLHQFYEDEFMCINGTDKLRQSLGCNIIIILCHIPNCCASWEASDWVVRFVVQLVDNQCKSPCPSSNNLSKCRINNLSKCMIIDAKQKDGIFFGGWGFWWRFQCRRANCSNHMNIGKDNIIGTPGMQGGLQIFGVTVPVSTARMAFQLPAASPTWYECLVEYCLQSWEEQSWSQSQSPCLWVNAIEDKNYCACDYMRL